MGGHKSWWLKNNKKKKKKKDKRGWGGGVHGRSWCRGEKGCIGPGLKKQSSNGESTQHGSGREKKTSITNHEWEPLKSVNPKKVKEENRGPKHIWGQTKCQPQRNEENTLISQREKRGLGQRYGGVGMEGVKRGFGGVAEGVIVKEKERKRAEPSWGGKTHDIGGNSY